MYETRSALRQLPFAENPLLIRHALHFPHLHSMLLRRTIQQYQEHCPADSTFHAIRSSQV